MYVYIYRVTCTWARDNRLRHRRTPFSPVQYEPNKRRNSRQSNVLVCSLDSFYVASTCVCVFVWDSFDFLRCLLLFRTRIVKRDRFENTRDVRVIFAMFGFRPLMPASSSPQYRFGRFISKRNNYKRVSVTFAFQPSGLSSVVFVVRNRALAINEPPSRSGTVSPSPQTVPRP